jgi:Na+/H+ antiporter NhaD/arsenite permease-like protein
MSPAAISVCALFLVIVISCVTRLNVGVLAVAMAWIIGTYFGGYSVGQIAEGFPVQLFLTLVGMTLLFSQAQSNGTLDKLVRHAVRGCRGNVGVMPIMFFLLAAAVASIGPGNIASAALIAPMAMAVAARAGVPAFLMAIMVGNGANAGSLSPFAPTGIIVNGLLDGIGLHGLEWRSYLTNLAAHAGVALFGYILFGGLRLFALRCDPVADERHAVATAAVGTGHTATAGLRPLNDPFDRNNWVTLGVITALLLGAIFLNINVGMGAFLAAGILGLFRAADHSQAIQKMPWNVIIMVSGVTVLIGLLERTEGLALFTDLLARVATRHSVSAVVAFLMGLVSVYSSTSGVVLPAFLPTVPGLSQALGGADPGAIALAMNVGSHLVDVSPLSTIGALCIAANPIDRDTRQLFNAMLAWGLSMTIVGAAVCYVLFRT